LSEEHDDEASDFSRYDEDDMPTREELAIWLSEFMSQSQKANAMYRNHFCNLLVSKLHSEFGIEGMCELMMAIDKRSGWVSDIIIEDNDIHDILFNEYGIFDNDAIVKARMSSQLTEMNKKIWRLRKKYAKLIAEEIASSASAPAKD
jgi:hypothetical protein